MAEKITSNQLREKFQQFFESKGHARIPSAPLVPENDPSVLFTTAGMHPLVPYLKGQSHPAGKRLVNVQKCLRTTDIDEVGDATHATVFEMLGNWSLGDYFKEDAIAWSWEFLTGKEWLGIDPNYLAVSVFAGDSDPTSPPLDPRPRAAGRLRGASAPRDEEAAQIWHNLGVSNERIAYLGKKDNWWPAGGGAPGPQGPDTEMFYWTGSEEPPAKFDPHNKRWVEIWNDVFMQFNVRDDGSLEPLPQQNVDTGMGLERVVMVLNRLSSIYEIDTYQPLLQLIEAHAESFHERHARILADHIKAATFILADDHPVTPSATERGYVVRRLIRRALRSARVLGIEHADRTLLEGLMIIVNQFGDVYPSLRQNKGKAGLDLTLEIKKFERVLAEGLKRFTDLARSHPAKSTLPSPDVFYLYQSYGFPIELIVELAREHDLVVDRDAFDSELKQHQQASRTAALGKFAGGLADHSQASIHYHTATHLLHQALRTVLGEHVVQKGSNITPERLRFDFSHTTKMTEDEIKKTEDVINQKIQEDLPVTREEMAVDEARARGALGLFAHKYSEKVSVYTIKDFSVEICGGPHVTRTGELGKFKIVKEESAGAGLRRIKAVFEN